MWTVIHIAKSQHKAEALQKALEKSGILSRVKTANKSLHDMENSYELLVPSAEIEKAHEVIFNIE